ncbi:MAG: tetratricopeptide repeat protein [Treponema sp.]|jgi:tetratricopeptide (TPR) repeat protein|nr:tetratricopeptide repeat protein [Treponema sp.]
MEYAKLGLWDLVIEDATTALRLAKPNDTTYRSLAYNYRGIAYAQKKIWERVIADFTDCLRDFSILDDFPGLNIPYLGDIYRRRGATYFVIGDYPRARRDFEKALQFDPRNEAARIGLEVIRQYGY